MYYYIQRFLELKPIFSALWLRWQVFYEVYKQCYYWLNERLTKAEQFSPLAKSNMKSVKREMEQLKVCCFIHPVPIVMNTWFITVGL